MAGRKSAAFLTAREEQVLRSMASGLTNRQIAARLCISPNTLQHHIAAIYTKLGCANRTEATLYAIRVALISSYEYRTEEAS